MKREDKENMEDSFLRVGHRQFKIVSGFQVCLFLVLDIRPKRERNPPPTAKYLDVRSFKK